MTLKCMDKLGRTVSVGDKVRLLELSPQFLKSLPADEIEDVRSLIGDIFKVYEIDSYGCAWIGKGWHNLEEGEYIGHSIGLESHEMELINLRDREQ